MTVATRLRTAGRVLLNPDQVSGLAVWLKADALVLSDNDPVATWTDASGNSRNATQGTAGARPLFKTAIFGAQPGVRFDGTDDLLTCPAFPSPLAVTTRIAALRPTLSAGDTHLISSVTADRQDLVMWPGGSLYYLFAGSNTGGPAIESGAQVVTAVFNGAASQIATNGGAPVIVNPGAGSWGQMALGGYGGGGGPPSSWAIVDIAEVAVWDRALTSDERRGVERGLGVKYGIAVT